MLWILKRKDEFSPQYDANNGFVIRAASEDRARELASTKSSDEGPNTWINPTASTCERLCPDGDEEVILVDFNAG